MEGHHDCLPRPRSRTRIDGGIGCRSSKRSVGHANSLARAVSRQSPASRRSSASVQMMNAAQMRSTYKYEGDKAGGETFVRRNTWPIQGLPRTEESVSMTASLTV